MRDLINSNSVPSNYFDGLGYFHGAPDCPGSSVTFSNDITCTQAEWDSGDGMAALLDALASIPWFDGVLKDGAMSKPLIMTPRQTLAFKARQLVGLITSLVGAPDSAVGRRNRPLAVYRHGVRRGELQDLNQPATYPDSVKYVYAFATAGGAVQPAIIMSPNGGRT